jgi:hypothetical protein
MSDILPFFETQSNQQLATKFLEEALKKVSAHIDTPQMQL